MFGLRNSRKNNVASACKECRSIEAKLYRELNKDALIISSKKRRVLTNTYQKQYIKPYLANNREKLSKQRKEYRDRNKDIIKIKQKKIYERDKEKIALKKKEYSKRPEAIASKSNSEHKRRSLTKQGDVTTQQFLDLKQNAKSCYWCNRSLKGRKVHIDHYVPLFRGGFHTISNLVVSCDKCNLTKNAKDPIVFANSIGKLF